MKPVTYIVTATNCSNVVHIEAALVSGHLTVCGHVDVPYIEVDSAPTCAECLEIVRFYKSLDLPEKRTSRRSK